MKQKLKKKMTKDRLFCITVLFLLIALIILSFINYIFIPATLICTSLELFCIGYLHRNEKEKEKLNYILFILGVILLVIAVGYTIIKTV